GSEADFFSAKARAGLQDSLKEYRSGMKPTLATLEALDSYLDALNALAQANKKSAENSKAAVDSVTNLVTAVSGFTFAGPAVNVATGLFTLAEQFRTARDFRKRVNLAAEIVEGGYTEVVDGDGHPVLDVNGKPKMKKACTGDAEDEITRSAGEIKDLIPEALNELKPQQVDEVKKLTPKEQVKKLVELGAL